MSYSLLYWFLMILWALFGLWGNWPFTGANVKTSGGGLLLFVLMVLVGVKVFGPPLHS